MAERLTRRQWLTWACIVSGMTYAETAESLGVKPSTIETVLKDVHRKLGTTGGGRYALPHEGVDHD